MPKDIKRVAVIGAGVMGAGIAAQIANGGTEVLLLDIVPKDVKKGHNRNIVADGALAKLKKTKPAALMHAKAAKRISTGNIEDNLKDLKTCDWIVEAIIENVAIKQDLYKKLAKVRKADAIVSSNTSTIPLDALTKGLPKDFQAHFCITHFFNPPRYMRLLELVKGKATKDSVMARVGHFGDVTLGKSIVPCHDTPGFIANRIGIYWLFAAFTHAMQDGIDVEAADAVLGRPTGVPKTGVFGLLDLVGLDVMPHILSSLRGALDKKDAFHALGETPKMLDVMLKDGYTGRKGKGGFYRLNANKKKEVKNLQSGEYSLAKRPKIPAALVSKKEGLRATLTHDSNEGRYARKVLLNVLAYSASLVGEIADDIETIDRAMRLGFNWKFGPFELMDKLGTAWLVKSLETDNIDVPAILTAIKGRSFYKIDAGQKYFYGLDDTYHAVPRPEGVLLLEDIKRASSPVMRNKSASVWDIGDGVLCLEFTSKMNSFNPLIFTMMHKASDYIEKNNLKGLVLHNEGAHYSVGANIGMLMIAQKLWLYPFVSWILRRGQSTFQRLKFSPFPVVAAPSGMALGGGCESVLAADAVTAHAETYIGLVEVGVGIIPGWGGCKELLGRAQEAYDSQKGRAPTPPTGPMPAVAHAFECIATAKVATSAFEAQDMHLLRPSDDVIMNKDRVLAAAKAKVLALHDGYAPRAPFTYRLPGPSGFAALKLALSDFKKRGMATPHDVVTGTMLAKSLTGSWRNDADTLVEMTEEDVLKFERDAFLPLTKTRGTKDRVSHMLKKGKPLRN